MSPPSLLLERTESFSGSIDEYLTGDEAFSGVLGHATPSFLEFFAGSGLVAEGLKPYFTAIWANDFCPKKQKVYAANHDATRFCLGSVTEVSGLSLPRAQMAWASFPCQDLSLAGHVGGIHASRSGLVWEWLRVLDEMPQRPGILVAENVVGLVSAEQGTHYIALHQALSERGYQVGAIHLDAAKWVPQSRPRIFVVAVSKALPIPLNLTDTLPNWAHSEAIKRVAARVDDWVWWRLPIPTLPVPHLHDIVEWAAPVHSPELNAKTLALISPAHRNILDAMPGRRLTLPGYKRTRGGKQVLELRFDGLAGCLRTPEGGSSRQTLILRRNGKLDSRLLTVRETARLMGAPDEFVLPGSYNEGYRAMGDAVAAPVARWLGQHLLSPLLN